MKISLKEINSVKQEISIDLDWSDIEKDFEKSLKEFSKKIKIAGFRPGKVPRKILMDRFQPSIEADFVEKSVNVYYLKALEEKEITPVGSPEPRSINTRILAATNRDLRQAIRIGSFREDLYFRLSTFRINVPPLRERTDDILPLANFFLMKYGDKRGELSVSPEALGKLLNYGWPGNVRELENVVQRAMVLSNGEAISAEHLFFDEPIHESHTETSIETSHTIVPGANQNLRNPHTLVEKRERSPSEQFGEGLQSAMDANEFRVISQTLKTARTRKEAASVLGISERTLRYKVAKMRERGIDIPRRRMGEI